MESFESQINGVVTGHDGVTRYFHNGVLHREDGPAYSTPNGIEIWYQDGEYHREDGPAITVLPFIKQYFLRGIEKTFDNWLAALDISDAEKVLLVMQWR